MGRKDITNFRESRQAAAGDLATEHRDHRGWTARLLISI
jgi:hypothetical protein